MQGGKYILEEWNKPVESENIDILLFEIVPGRRGNRKNLKLITAILAKTC